jgi:hypothetical protein
MSQLNPITGSILQAPDMQRTQDMDKARQLRQAQDAQKNTAAHGEEEVEESVPSTDELQAVGDEHHARDKRKKNYTRHAAPEPEKDEEGDGLDLTA